MRKLLLFLLCLPCFAQQVNTDIFPASTGLKLGHSNQQWDAFLRNVTISGTCTGNGCGSGGSGNGLATYTVATLPASPPPNTYATVTDATGASCTVGGGTATNLCRFTGFLWVIVSGSAGGAGNPGGLDTEFQINNSAAFGGATAQNATTHVVYSKTTGKVSVPNLSSIRFADSYAWSQSPGTDLTSAGSKTVTLAPCPLGVDVSNNANAPYKVYVSTTGTPEVVAVTGGTCAAGAASGTVTFTTVNTHANGYTVSSSSGGIQEALNDACAGSGNCQVQLSPASGANPNYIVYATVYVKGMGAGGYKVHLIGNGAYLNCATRDVCIFNGNRASSGKFVYTLIQGLRFKTDLAVDGAQITGISAASGTYTVTAAGHPYVTGDYASVEYYSPNASNHTIRQVTVVNSSTFTFTLGSATFSNTAPTWGWTNIENTAIEDDAQGSVIRDIDFAGANAAGGNSNGFSYGIIVDNDQNANLEHITNSNGALRCTANFCGTYIYSRGDVGANGVGNFGIVHLSDSDFTGACAGNGVLARSGNGLSIRDSVIQAFNQYGVKYEGGLQGASISNLYQEVGGCTNPQYPGLQVAAGLYGQQYTVTGDAPIQGFNPKYANTGSNQRNYFIVPKSPAFGAGPILFVGYATTNNAGTVNVYWPQVVNDTAAGAISYDVLVTLGANTVGPYAGSANSLTTGISGSCTNGICTFADTHAASSAYTVVNQLWFPHLYFWPGAYVGSDNTNRDASFGVNLQFNLTKLGTSTTSGYASSYGYKTPSAFATNCNLTQVSLSPSFIVCQNAPSTSGPGTATVLQQASAVASPPANVKGRLNLGPTLGNLPAHLVTLCDSNIFKTLATANNRPSNDANDCFIGMDQSGGISLGSQTSITQYLANIGDNTSWLERLTTTLKTLKVPLSVLSGGSSSTLNIADSGAIGNCDNGTNNSVQLCSATPGTNTSPSGVYWPIWATNISGAKTSSQIELIANKDAINGYPSLDSAGLMPISELVTATAGCNATSFIKGDRSGCGSVSAAPGFDSISTGSNVSATMTVGTGATLTFSGNGIVNASQIRGSTYPDSSAVSGGIGNPDRVLVTTAANVVSGRTMANCTASGFFEQYDTSTHNFNCVAVPGTIPSILFACTGTSGACPNATEYIGDAADQIAATVTVPASSLATGKCIHAIAWLQHTTGTASVSYRWNVGGTGAVNTDVTGGTSATAMASNSTSSYIETQFEVCAYAANTVYLRTHSLQTGSTQVTGGLTQAVSLTLSSNFNINFLFNVAATDKITFNGGYANFP